MNGNKIVRVNVLFSLCSAKVADIQSDIDKSSLERLRSVMFEWRRISLPTIKIIKRIAREVFGSYSSMPIKDPAEASKHSNQKPLTQQELLAQLKESLKRGEVVGETATMEPAVPKAVIFKRMSRSTVYSMFLGRGQFEKFANDTYLDVSKSLNIFMQHATTEFNGKYVVNFKLFKKVLKKLAKSRYPSMGPFSSLKRFCYYDLRKRAKLYRGWRKVNALRFKPKIQKVLDPRFIALRKAKLRNAALSLQRSWRKRRLRIKAMSLIRRFIKRHAEWRRTHPMALLDSQISKMTEEVEEEIEPLDGNKKKKTKGAFSKCFNKVGHLILGTKEEVDSDDESDEDDDLTEQRDLDGLTETERLEWTIQDINKSRNGTDWDAVTETILLQMKEEIDRDKSLAGVDSRDVNVNWKQTANIMAFHVALPKILYQYYSIAAAHGPLEPTQDSKSNLEDPNRDIVNTDFLQGISGFMSIPQLTMPNVSSGINSFHFTFWGAVVVALIYPFYTIKALRQLKAGKLGLDKHGRPVTKFCSKDGLYNFGLNAVNDYLYFGMMVQFVSVFACKIDDLAPQPGELNFKYVRYILMADTKYVRIPNYGLNGTISNYTVTYEYPPMECFNPKQPTHMIYMVMCTIAILCFYPLATLLAPNFQFNNKMLDIKFEQSFLIIQNQAELLMVAFSIFYQETWQAVLIPQLLICVTLAASNWFIQPCLIERLNIFRTGIYSMAACACMSSIFYQVVKDGFGGVFCYPDVGKTSRSIESSCEPYFISSGAAFGFLICSWIMICLIVLCLYKKRQKKASQQKVSLDYEKLEDDTAV